LPSTSDIEAVLADRARGIPDPQREDQLRERLCAYVDAARSEGMLPEQVVIAVRDAVKRSGARLADRTTQRVTQWCMERYFERHA
jgi:hypothetical protein